MPEVKMKKEKIVHTAIDRFTWKQLAHLAADKETTMSNLVRLGIQMVLESEGKQLQNG